MGILLFVQLRDGSSKPRGPQLRRGGVVISAARRAYLAGMKIEGRSR